MMTAMPQLTIKDLNVGKEICLQIFGIGKLQFCAATENDSICRASEVLPQMSNADSKREKEEGYTM